MTGTHMVRWKRFLLAAGCATAAAVAVLSLAPSSSLEGCYEDTVVGTVGSTYWRFKEGHVELVTIDGGLPYGTYTNVEGRWIWTDRAGGQFLLKPSVRELRILDPDNEQDVEGWSHLKRICCR